MPATPTLPLLVSFFLTCCCALGQPPTGPDVLDEYLAASDNAYKWELVHMHEGDGYITFVVDLTSQTWLSDAEVNRTTWKHWLTIVRPDDVRHDTALLFIGGGSNDEGPPRDADERTRMLALGSRSIVAELGTVPNQPLIFHNDGTPRYEDDLIGYAWDHFLKTRDARWIPRLPMVKSAVRAMDTVVELMNSEQGGHLPIGRFVVAGGSKRGWTTWLTGASDTRVTAIIPIVIDVLNVRESMLHHFAAYGFWAPAIGDYVEHGLMERFEHPRMKEIHDLVDPISYRHRLTMPKYIVNAAGDQFFLPDSSQFYFSELEGEKYLRYVPNADHSLRGSDAQESIIAYYALIRAGRERPRFTWTEGSDGSLHVKTVDRPRAVRLWHATNPHARDFRLETLGPKYTSEVLEDQGGGVYVGNVDPPEKGWTAYLVELEYDVGVRVPLKLTTAVRVVPDVLPYAGKDPTGPATITVVCKAPSEDVARGVTARIAKLIVAKNLAKGDATTRLDGTTCRVNYRPAGRFEESARAVIGWLREQGCSDLQYEFHAGPETAVGD